MDGWPLRTKPELIPTHESILAAFVTLEEEAETQLYSREDGLETSRLVLPGANDLTSPVQSYQGTNGGLLATWLLRHLRYRVGFASRVLERHGILERRNQ